MQKTVRCTRCEGVFVPPREPPFFPCPKCREGDLCIRFADHLTKSKHTGEPVELASQQDLTYKVVAVYSLLRHTVFEGTYQECQGFMAENGGDLLEKGYHDWELVSKEKAHKKVDELAPPRHARTPSHEVRFKYSPHYPKARPTTADGVAEYQGYEVAGLRWVYVEEVD